MEWSNSNTAKMSYNLLHMDTVLSRIFKKNVQISTMETNKCHGVYHLPCFLLQTFSQTTSYFWIRAVSLDFFKTFTQNDIFCLHFTKPSVRLGWQKASPAQKTRIVFKTFKINNLIKGNLSIMILHKKERMLLHIGILS